MRPVSLQHDLKRASDVEHAAGTVSQHADGAATLDDLWTVTTGSLVQVHGTAALTLLTLLSVVAQARSQRPVVYVAASEGTLFPPDAAECGVDLTRFFVARPRDEVQTGAMIDAFLRSGLVELLLVDLHRDYRFDLAHLFRFAHVARHTAAHLYLFSVADPGLLASSVAMRIHARHERRDTGTHIRLRFLRSRSAQRDVVIPLDDRLH